MAGTAVCRGDLHVCVHTNGCRDDPSSKAAVVRFAAEAAAILSPERPGDFNQVRDAGAATRWHIDGEEQGADALMS